MQAASSGLQEHDKELFNVIAAQTVQVGFAELIDAVEVNDRVPIFKRYPDLRRVIALAVYQAIRDVIVLAVKRSAALAVRTTAELIKKDFVVDPDANKMKNAAANMVQDLTTKLAMVYSKEPLRT
jgi:Domain of unknown function (DUF3819)